MKSKINRMKMLCFTGSILAALFALDTAVYAQTVRFKGETCPLPVMSEIPAEDAVMPEAGVTAALAAEAAAAREAAALSDAGTPETAADPADVPAEVPADPAANPEEGTEPVERAAVIEDGMAVLNVSAADFLGSTRDGTVILVRTAGVFGYMWLSDAEDLLPLYDFSSLPAVGNPIVIGEHSEAARILQGQLIQLGFLAGTADGAYGQQTAQAVREFQASAGLRQTGTADAFTQLMLYEKITQPETIVMNYPQTVTVEDKFAEIAGTAGSPDLSAYLDKSWKFRYDVYSGTGSIGTDRVLGELSVEEPAVDRIRIQAEAVVSLSSDGETMQADPVLLIEAEGTARPYIKNVYLASGGKVCEIGIVSRDAGVSGTSVFETVQALLDDEAYAFLDGLGENAAVVLHLVGQKDYDMFLENGRKELEGLKSGL